MSITMQLNGAKRILVGSSAVLFDPFGAEPVVRTCEIRPVLSRLLSFVSDPEILLMLGHHNATRLVFSSLRGLAK